MTYSANHFEDADYGIAYATVSNLLGLWQKSTKNPIQKNDFAQNVSGLGHNSIIKSPDGSEWFIAYHTHANATAPDEKRVLNIDRFEFQDDGTLSVKGPTRKPQEYPSNAMKIDK